MSLLETLQNRRSVRQYTNDPIPPESLQAVLEAGLLSASSRGIRPWELIIVQDPEALQRMAQCRVGSAKMLEKAKAAIVVVADETKSDVWIEDSAIVMANMHLMADSLGLGSCWIQGRLRKTPGGDTTESYLRDILHFPDQFRLLAMLSLGVPATHAAPTPLESLPYEKIHRETF